MNGPTSLPWAVGYGEGLTGPTTPAVCGVTVAEEIQYGRWKDSGNPNDFPHGYHIPIRHGMDTVTIVPSLPGGNGPQNAELIAEAVNTYPELVDVLQRLMGRATRDLPAGNWAASNEPEIFAAWSLLIRCRERREKIEAMGK